MDASKSDVEVELKAVLKFVGPSQVTHSHSEHITSVVLNMITTVILDMILKRKGNVSMDVCLQLNHVIPII